MMVTAYIGFGSNLGDRQAHLRATLDRLSACDHITLKRVSRLYQTEPHKKNTDPQPWYLNCVLEIETSLTLHQLLSTLKLIEKELGRKTKSDWKPRPVDLDILLYGTIIYQDNGLRVPHSDLTQRRFVLQTLCDLCHTFLHPEYQMSLQELLNCCTDKLKVVDWENKRNVFQISHCDPHPPFPHQIHLQKHQ